jgi:hypothetical protein
MANISDSSLHDFATGEKVTESMLDQNFKVIQAAVNDNDKTIRDFGVGSFAPATMDGLKLTSTTFNQLKFGYVKNITDPMNARLTSLETTGVSSTFQTQIDDLNKRLSSVIPVEQYGAIGDGITDDTVALQNAINAIQGTSNTLKLTEGKTYKITNTLQVTASLSIVGSKQNRPKIYSDSQNFDGINIQGILKGSTTLFASATVNTKYIAVMDASNISDSSLIELISSVSWYHDPRSDSTDARKAELHRVDEIVGNKVYLTDPLFDGYDISSETVTVNIYTPICLAMSDIDVQLTKYPSVTDSIRQTGIILNHTIDAILDNVNVIDAQDCGISCQHSYRPHITGGRTEGSNNYYSGYGVQIVGCTHAKVKGRHTVNSRRGVDVSGMQIPSHMTVVEECTVFGSGTNSMGTRYVYNDDHSIGAYAGGIGTHGPADHTIIRNNIFGFLHVAVIDRGRNCAIEGNYFLGEIANTCIDISFGENTTVINNYTYDGFSGVKNKTIFDGGANINVRKPPVFVRIQDSALVNGATAYWRIENNFAMVQDRFIELYGETGGAAIPTIKDLIVKNNHVLFSPQGSSDPAYFIKNSDVTTSNILISGSVVKNNSWERASGTGKILEYYGVDPRTGSEVEGSKSYSFYLSTDTASSIFLGDNNVTYVRVGVDCAGANGLVRVTQGATTTNAWGTPVNIACASGVLSGTTGTTGTLNLSVQDGMLYVENRLGSTQRILLTVFTII